MWLERLMQVFHDNPVMEKDILQGSLTKTGNESIKIVSHQLALQELYNLWGVVSSKAFKLSASYMLPTVKIPSMKSFKVGRVEKRLIDLAQSPK